MIAEGHVTINGRPVTQKQLLQTGDKVHLNMPPVVDTKIPGPERIPLTVLHEDRDILAIDKPAGLVVHPAPGHDSGTLVNALLHHYRDVDGIGGEGRPGIVHRLDKDTSGVILVARNEATYLALGRQFRQRLVRKEYLALVYGTPVPATGTIDAALARHPRDRQRYAVTANGGRAALTFYRVEETLPGASLVNIRIATGRTHQIRVHLAWRGHPVLGDLRYGQRKRSQLAVPVPRQMLHAHRIRFVHPATGSHMLITAPVPPDMRDLLQILRTA